ncbi:hypothetical protein QZH41_002933 [Actinostola sp. cb2023]|nr:hypothetical protein QZH41_002933 [Actinostola sp. cb2023]
MSYLPMPDSASGTINTQNGENKPDGKSNATLSVENPEKRRGSTYDLLGFLSLNAKGKTGKEQSCQGETSETPAPSHFLFPGPNETGKAEELRRSSAYDLIEFLSLRQNEENLKSESNQSQSRQSQPVSLRLPSEDPDQDPSRKGSIYNLEEFLDLSHKNISTVPKVLHKETGPSENALLSPRLPSTLNFKRDSIYDLQEFLGILQKEAEETRLPLKPTEKDLTKDGDAASDDSTTEVTNPHLQKDKSIDADALKPEELYKNRSLSIYDLRDFLSLYAAQSQSNVGNQLRRKPSEISQSSIMINVSEDEHGNSNVDDVFLAVPVEGSSVRKRSSIASVAELNELLTILNDTTRKKSISDRGAPTPVSRHDSGGAKSFCDLGEFLSVLNSDNSPLRRRLSSISGRGSRCPSSLSRNDSSGSSSLYDLEEFLAVLNDSGQRKEENAEISIPVPQLPSRLDRNVNDQISHLRLSRGVNSETTGNATDGH